MEVEMDNFQYKSRDLDRFERDNDVIVHCLKCNKDTLTSFAADTSCLQCCCCCLLLVMPPLCCVPCCMSGCSERFHKCTECGTLLYKAEPCSGVESQYGS